VSLADELGARGHDASAVSGARSQFDVVVDGTVLFSKQREHRFPELEELLASL
jgi:Rdx family protein